MPASELKFTGAVTSYLRAAGWSETRWTDVTESMQYLVERGYSVHSFAEEALVNLSGLEFDLPDGGISWLAFDTRGAIRFITLKDKARVERLVGESISPIGHGGGFVLFLAPSGRAFLLQDEWFCLIRFRSLNDLLHFVFTADQSTCEEIPLGDE
jgi:hypothetical protein